MAGVMFSGRLYGEYRPSGDGSGDVPVLPLDSVALEAIVTELVWQAHESVRSAARHGWRRPLMRRFVRGAAAGYVDAVAGLLGLDRSQVLDRLAEQRVPVIVAELLAVAASRPVSVRLEGTDR